MAGGEAVEGVGGGGGVRGGEVGGGAIGVCAGRR